MRVVTPEVMRQLFEVTDSIPLEREALVVPLEMEGEGSVERLPDGRIQVTLPDSDDLGPFLADLRARLAPA